MTRHVVATVDELKPGQKKLVVVKGREIGLFNVGGEYFALANRCPHEGGPMCEGRITGLVQSKGPGDYSITRKGDFIRCPWHGWEFEIRSGQSYCDPQNLRMRQFKAEVAPGAELVKGPYVAESFAVTVDENYVVVEV